VLHTRRATRYFIVTLNVLLLVAIGAFAFRGTGNQQVLSRAASNVTNDSITTTSGGPLDQISSADIAANTAKVLNLTETTAVNNQADSVAAELAVSAADSTVIAKPQAVVTTFASSKDIKTYIVANGDTASSIAAKFNVTSDSVMWSNNLSGNTVNAGTKLSIPPVNGIVYTVKSGDTVDSLASKYRTNKDQIIAVNDIELTGLKANEQILIPNGQQPAAPAVVSFGGGFGTGPAVAVYGAYNGYDYGFCTWYVAKHRADVGNPLPQNLGNASTWDDRAAAMGLLVNKTPAVGAAVVTSQSGAGHVAFVEAVNADGSIWVSEMNSYGQVSMTDSTPRGGWGVRDYKPISAGTAASYNYVH
jgi:surface antigen